MRLQGLITISLRVAVGSIFLLAGAVKIQALGGQGLGSTVLGQLLDGNEGWIFAVSILEIGFGACLIFGMLPAAAIGLTAAVVASVSIWSLVDDRFRDTPCGCFGDSVSLLDSSVGTLALRNAILVLALLWLLVAGLDRRSVRLEA
jgi:uncharacterized membrane protein YphA (DoxX/SURF4 family)